MESVRILYIGNCLAGRGGNPTTIDILSEKLALKFKVIKVSEKENLISRIFDIWWAVIVNRKTVDVLLIDTYSTLAFHFAWSSAFLARMFNIPYIPIIHGGDFPKRMEQSKKLVWRFLNSADNIITPSGYLKDKISHLAAGKTRIIPNFLNSDDYPITPHTRMESVKLLWVRALAEIYNPKMAIDVLSLLHSRGIKQATLTMVGPDKENIRNGLIEYAKSKGILDALQITGKLSKQEWVGMASDFDCFINTTIVDNTPVSVMEAMTLGLPVISTSVGGIPYIITDRVEGLLVRSGDVEGMFSAICELIKSDSYYLKVSQAARKKALTWNWKVVEADWSELLVAYSSSRRGDRK